MPLESSAESPVPLRTVSRLVGDWVHRLGWVWVEGQVTQLSHRSGSPVVFLVLRDPAADVSMSVRVSADLLRQVAPPVTDGTRVAVHARPELYLNRGSLSLHAQDVRHVGVGDLLVRIERLKQVLGAEGLFDADRKQRLPFLPRAVGLVCGRGSAAEHDVLENARVRWPGVQFVVKNVPVQGPHAVPEVVSALRALDRGGEVDVVVIARGGGSVEDLLPFSDEALVRAVAACRVPVVSAIGHEQDSPLLDLVADVRASTPTDAAKRVVPDVARERAALRGVRQRLLSLVRHRLDGEQARLEALVSRPVLVDPATILTPHTVLVQAAAERGRRAITRRLDTAAGRVETLSTALRTLSPQATLDRGYAVLRTEAGAVVRTPADTAAGDVLHARVAEGELTLTVSASGARETTAAPQ